MVKKFFATAETLAAYLNGFGDSFLFRGQASHYETPEGDPSLTTSFSRHPCVPVFMYAWAFYAAETIRILARPTAVIVPTLGEVQALFQHYGWRSFFIDVTANASVACWFACNRFSLQPTMHLSNDCFDKPVYPIHDTADFTPSDDVGHVYVLSREAMSQTGVRQINLNRIPIDADVRFRAQAAWLIGPISQAQGGLLDPSCIAAHVSAPPEVFRQLAAAAGHQEVSSLFPGPEQDPIYDLLLAMPWQRLTTDNSENDMLPAYVHPLRLPVYGRHFQKNYPPDVAFYKPIWFADGRRRRREPFRSALFLRAPDTIYHVRNRDDVGKLPALRSLLSRYGRVVVETESIIPLPEERQSTSYAKGVAALTSADGRIEVGELFVDHPGTQIAGWGMNKSYSYKWVQDTLKRAPSPDDCQCGNIARHEHHLTVLASLNSAVAEGKVKRRRPLTWELLDN